MTQSYPPYRHDVMFQPEHYARLREQELLTERLKQIEKAALSAIIALFAKLVTARCDCNHSLFLPPKVT